MVFMVSGSLLVESSMSYEIVPLYPDIVTTDYGVQVGGVTVCDVQHVLLDLYPYILDSSPVIMVFMKSGSLYVEYSMSCETCTRIPRTRHQRL